MRAGRKPEAETGKTRPCIVYVKDLGGAAAAAAAKTKILRSNKTKIKAIETRETRQTRRTAPADSSSTPIPIGQRLKPNRGLITSAPPATRNTRSGVQQQKPVTPPRVLKKEKPSLLSRRRITTVVAPTPTPPPPARVSQRRATLIESTAKSKMYRSSQVQVAAAASPPPTIAASRSRRSIKPNPKYNSEDLVTPKYMMTLNQEQTSPPRRGKQLFVDDVQDLIELDEEGDEEEEEESEDNDDELADAAFNPQLHQEEDEEEDLSDPEFEKQPVKRGRGRPPKMVATPKPGNNLQQLRRSMAANMARTSLTAALEPATNAAKRKLEDPGETAIKSKRLAMSRPAAAATSTMINGSKKPQPPSRTAVSITPRAAAASAGPTYVAKPTAARPAPRPAPRPATRPPPRPAATGPAKKVAAAAPPPAASRQDVPTFTIVNIDDIINQDDVLISRQTNHKLSAAAKQRSNVTTNHKVLASSNNHAQLTTKPRPRILNAEVSKKTPVMKPLMSMGQELCTIDTEEEEDQADAELAIRASRVKTTKWMSPATAASAAPQRRHVLSTKANNRAAAGGLTADRKLTKLLGEGSEESLFKKPVSPPRRSKENEDEATPPHSSSSSASVKQYFPPETTTFCEEDGRMIKKITCYETWHVIGTPPAPPSPLGDATTAASTVAASSSSLSPVTGSSASAGKTRQQRTCLELPLVKLANVAARIKVPNLKWTSKVTLYKVSPSLMQRQTMTIFTGDLKTYNIPEEDRHKYQPSCVLFRRSVLDRSKCRVPYDRAIIFKNKCFYANIDGKHVNLMGAPEVVGTVKDVEILLDIVDRLSLSSSLVEMVNSK